MPLRLGAIVRADHRGLAYQTGEFYRAMRPDVTVAVDISKLPRGERWPQDFTQYPDAIVTEWSPPEGIHFSHEALQALLSCDVIYSAETLYDDRLPRLAKRRGVATVRHINCELYWPEGESHPWYPTSWRLPNRPEGPTVPVPVPDDKIRGPAGEGLVLHVAGWKAANDRNGTQLIRNAVRATPDVKWRVTSQYGRPVSTKDTNVEIVGDIEDRWEMYDGCSMLVLPRKYGGLCLPAQESAARGLAVVMTDTEPQNGWPIELLPIQRSFPVRKRHVDIGSLHFTSPKDIAAAVENLTGQALLEAQERTVGWAQSLAWSKWADTYRMMLHQAAEEMQ